MTLTKLSWQTADADSQHAMRNLIQRLSLGAQGKSPRTITFIAARAQEGTSTIARNYALALAAETAQKILLIDAGTFVPQRFHAFGNAVTGIVDAALAGRGYQETIHPIGPNVFIARWISNAENRILATHVIHHTPVWKNLTEFFDTMVIDAPSLQASLDGLALAAMSDAVALVVEAEATPQPVVENLRDTLLSAQAKIVGVVMNKRRYYIPQKLYK